MAGGPFQEPFILVSEHKRILGATQERYDHSIRQHRQIGFWKGIACTVWIAGISAFVVGLAAFNAGINLQ
jgi:hypothetical protein